MIDTEKLQILLRKRKDKFKILQETFNLTANLLNLEEDALSNNLDKFGDAVSAGKINREISNAIGDSGSIHRLRHNYAINTVKYFEGQGYSHTEAVHLTSLEMGHNRNEIIEGVYSK